MIACIVRDSAHPSRKRALAAQARGWEQPIQRCRADRIGDRAAHGRSSAPAHGARGVESLAAREASRERLQADPLGVGNHEMPGRDALVRPERRALPKRAPAPRAAEVPA